MRCIRLDKRSIENTLESSRGTTGRKERTYCPQWVALWTTRSSLSKRLSTLLKRVRLQNLRIRAKNWFTTGSLYHKTSHCCLRLKILLKALLRLKKQSWTTNKFVLCWLHHGVYQSEKQVRNDHKFITLKEMVWCQVHFIVWTSFHGHRETFGMALTSEKIGSRRIFRKRGTWWYIEE